MYNTEKWKYANSVGVLPKAILGNHAFSCEEKMILAVLYYPKDAKHSSFKINMHQLSKLSSVNIKRCREIIEDLVARELIYDVEDFITKNKQYDQELDTIIYSGTNKLYHEYVYCCENFPCHHKEEDEHE